MLKDPKATKDAIVQWIRDYFDKNGPGCSAVIGISGGKDSSIAAALCAEALGKYRVLGVIMPDRWQPDINDALALCEHLDIPHTDINIGSTTEALLSAIVLRAKSLSLTEQAKINLPPRIRMATLYAVAQCLPEGGRVVNTCNRSEDFVGYSTKFGDSAGDFSPLANLMVHEVRQIGYELPIPRELVDKTPADGLCGKSDEDNLGFTYAQVDHFIEHGTCGIMSVDCKIQRLHDRNLHKLLPMPAFRKDAI